jgi:hypothetical protein
MGFMAEKTQSNPEYAAFQGLLKGVLSVPHSEIKKRIEEEKKQKGHKKRAHRKSGGPSSSGRG